MIAVPATLWPLASRRAGAGEWPPRDAAAVARLFEYAQREMLLPLLLADETVPDAVAAAKPRWRAFDALQRRHHELVRAGTRELLRVVGHESVMIYKGGDYRHRLYPRPELRPMRDLDVLAPSRAIPGLLARLEAAGYPRTHAKFGAPFLASHHELSVMVLGLHVELHRSFAQRIRSGVDYDGIWQRREAFEADGLRAFRPAPADAIVMHAYNLSIDEFASGLLRFLDFHLLLQRHAGELPACVARARAWGTQRALFGALHLVARLFPEADTPAVQEAQVRLLDARTRRFLVERVLPDLARGAGREGGRLVQLWRKFALMDRRWRRLAFVVRHAVTTPLGWVAEWRARRRGAALPARASLR